MMSVIQQVTERLPRRGELEVMLEPSQRHTLREIYRELLDLHHRAENMSNSFLAELIGTAKDEARDQLRDDMMMREAEAKANGQAFAHEEDLY